MAGLKHGRVLVVHGGFAPKYEILNTNQQPQPHLAVKELTRDQSKLFELFSLNHDELTAKSANISSFAPSYIWDDASKFLPHS